MQILAKYRGGGDTNGLKKRGVLYHSLSSKFITTSCLNKLS